MGIPFALLEAMPPGAILHFDKEFLLELGIQWVNTIILAVILAKVLYNPVKSMLDQRAQRVSSQLSGAEKASAEAGALKQEYESKLSHIEVEKAEILDSAKALAKASADRALADARDAALKLRNRAAADIRSAEENAKAEMKKEILDISMILAGKFVAASLDEKTSSALVDDALDELGGVKWLA
jgi:F-type H+-transporting ATPase subunit b